MKLVFYITLFIFIQNISSTEYKVKDPIPVIIDKVWPKGNPSEPYDYFSLPFCPPKEQVGEGFAYSITGSRKYISNHNIEFGVDKKPTVLCDKKKLTEKDVAKFRYAVDKDYYFLMHVDDLPLREHIGQKTELPGGKIRYVLFTHIDFIISYNQNQIISIQLSKKVNPIDISKDEETEVEFSYSVQWQKTEEKYVHRLEKYVDSNQHPEEVEIQWFSIINSLVLVILLTCFLAFILIRILKRDVQKYTDPEDKDESGWKYIHTDVFRFPKHINLLASLLGNGAQLFGISVFVLSLSLLGVFYPDYSYRTMYTAMIIVYVLTTGINGFVSGMFYKQFGGEEWIKNTLLSTFLFVGPLFLIWSILNSIALTYGSTAAFPFKSIAFVLGIYFLISFPLTLIGSITAKNFVGPFTAPCRTKQVPREIPPIAWYKSGLSRFLIAGFLPFSSIYIELFYVFISLWGTIMYTPYIILSLVFAVLIIVTSCITVSMTYLQVSQEDYNWWWSSILAGGSTSIFIFGYSIFFYIYESSMEGKLQLAFFFGYTLLTCYGFFLMLAFIGFISSMIFLKQIYGAIKID